MPMYNDAATIRQSLESIAANRYRRYSVLVVDNASDDTSRQLVRQYIREHPRRPIRLVARRSHIDSVAGLVYQPLRRYAAGSAVYLVPASHSIGQTGLQLVAQAIKRQPQATITAHLTMHRIVSYADLLQSYGDTLRLRKLKAGAVRQPPAIIPAGLSAHRLRTALQADTADMFIDTVEQFRLRPTSIQSYVAVARVDTNQALRRPVSFVLRLVLPFVLLYVSYLSFDVQQRLPLYISIGVAAWYVLMATLADRQSSVRKKLWQTVGLPFVYLAWLGWSVLPYVVMVSNAVGRTHESAMMRRPPWYAQRQGH